jgi:glycerol-3-phosphate O-acyltransferase
MDSGPPPTFNLFIITQEMQDKLDALLRRPTPATQAELVQFAELLKTILVRQQAEAAQLTKTVQTLLQPVAQFNEAALAQRLTAAIGPQLPTPAGLTQAGEQAGQAIQRAVQTAINQATNSIQAFSRQVTCKRAPGN